MKNEAALSKNDLISQLAKSPHGKLAEYVPVATRGATEDPEFYSKLTAWNAVRGQIRDSKVALPVIGLRSGLKDDYRENALAHLAALDPRNLYRAVNFNKEMGPGLFRTYQDLVRRYLYAREDKFPWWERQVVQHRASMGHLYEVFRIKPKRAIAGDILFDQLYPIGSVFQVIKDLPQMSSAEAAGHIMEKKIPFLIAAGALGAKANDPDLVMALIDRMSATELVTNSKRLQKMGVQTNPALRAAYEKALTKARGGSQNILKATVAADATDGVDETMAVKLKVLQERQLEAQKAKGKGIDGNWLVLADKSGSMHQAIESARQVTALLTKMVTGKVWMIFFDQTPRFFDMTGKTYEEVVAQTKTITAGGGTSIGCGLQYAIDAKLEIDGIAIVSDGGENQSPTFGDRYRAYRKAFDREPAVYLYRTAGEADVLTLQNAEIGIQKFDLGEDVDFYSIPNLVSTMRASRFSLIDEIYGARLLKLDDILGTA